MKSVWIASSCLALLTAAPAWAQSTGSDDVMNGSGRTVEDVMQQLMAKALHLPDDATKLAVPAQKQTAWNTESKRLKDRLAQHRRDCRESIRRANRDTLMPTALQCYRSDLLQDINWLRAFVQHRSSVPYTDPGILATTTGAIMRLIDAETTIVNGIDAGVFETMESLEAAKRNLRSQYRLAFLHSRTLLETDRELTYLYFIAKGIYSLDADTLSSGAVRIQRDQTIQCLNAAHKALLSVLQAADWPSASASLKTALEGTDGCVSRFRSLVRTVKDVQEAKTEHAGG